MVFSAPHRATLRHYSSDGDFLQVSDEGIPIRVPPEKVRGLAVRFFNQRVLVQTVGSSGETVVRSDMSLHCLLPPDPGCEVAVGDELVGGSAPFDRVYRIDEIAPVPAVATLHHMTVRLHVVVPEGRDGTR